MLHVRQNQAISADRIAAKTGSNLMGNMGNKQLQSMKKESKTGSPGHVRVFPTTVPDPTLVLFLSYENMIALIALTFTIDI